jgi:hypothetical protein
MVGTVGVTSVPPWPSGTLRPPLLVSVGKLQPPFHDEARMPGRERQRTIGLRIAATGAACGLIATVAIPRFALSPALPALVAIVVTGILLHRAEACGRMPGRLAIITTPAVVLGIGFFVAALAMGSSASVAGEMAMLDGMATGAFFGAVAFLLLYAFVDPRWIVGEGGEEEAQVGDRTETA